jgi:hypothetical protein
MAVSSNGYGAGIGGGNNISCGNIVIKGGHITATGGSQAAGIGGGESTSCGNITISGGIIEATGGQSAVGIGSGSSQNNTSTCAGITIVNTTTKLQSIAGTGSTYNFGASNGGTCGTITIVGTVRDQSENDFDADKHATFYWYP